jgi:5-formyltetrahydrofolate cyclo-ligase
MFSSFRSEVDTTELLRQALCTQKPVYLPKVLGKEMKFYQIESLEELEIGYQGILEPKEDKHKEFIPSENQKIFVLMPGAVFDREGGRIGYGSGFYDKFLASLEKEVLPENLCKLAVAYECQLVENGMIHREIHDISPDYIVTEKTCIQIMQISG